MSTKLLNRSAAPFGDGVWQRLDAAVTAAARDRLAGRRLLPLEGPHGLEVASIPGPERSVGEETEPGAALSVAASTPLLMIRGSFALSAREVATFEEPGLPFDAGPAVRAAAACAAREDDLVFKGLKAPPLPGLMTAAGARAVDLSPWETVGAAVDEIIRAAGELDRGGFGGPYALALAPVRYNALFRRYPDSGGTELEHMRELATGGVFKAPAAGAGGVLVAAVEGPNAIVVGQDLVTSYVGPSGRDYGFVVSETVALRLGAPEAVCVLR